MVSKSEIVLIDFHAHLNEIKYKSLYYQSWFGMLV
jgi:hypothetical protein